LTVQSPQGIGLVQLDSSYPRSSLKQQGDLMKRFLCVAALLMFVISQTHSMRADDKEVKAVLDKAIKALGGEAKLGKAANFTGKAKGKLTLMGNESEFTSETTAQGLDRYRGVFEADFGGMPFKGVTVLNGDKGWRKFGDMGMELDKDALANEKRNAYMN